MTDPERLLSGGTAFERGLLGAAAVEKPSAAMLARMEHGLGLSSAGTVSVVSAKVVLAVLGTGAAGGLAIWGLVAANNPAPAQLPSDHQSVAAEVAAPEATTMNDQASPSKAAASDVEPERGGEARVSDLPLVENDTVHNDKPALRQSTPRQRARASAPGQEPAAKSDQLKQEVQQLDRVRAAIGAGDRDRALQLLDGYDRKFPNGTLAPEAAKLRHSARN